jgi:hypothetical protein
MLDAGAYRMLIGPRIHIATPPRVMRWPHHDDHLHAMFLAVVSSGGERELAAAGPRAQAHAVQRIAQDARDVHL